ncbi:dUTP diphosphatase [Succinatimonas hippei]|uniref:dUTP diphosphatase n=1 Tax=Succinatimonas hippei TaxID=626938 RepID=UPI002492C433|nr:hypothetical protein [Succinatimonas hippei]
MIDKEKAVIFCEWLEKRLKQLNGGMMHSLSIDEEHQMNARFLIDLERHFHPVIEEWNDEEYKGGLKEAQTLLEDASVPWWFADKVKIVKSLKCELVTDEKGRKGYMPTRAHDEDAGFDLYCPYNVEYIADAFLRTINPHHNNCGKERLPNCPYVTLDMLIKIEIPRGYVGLILPRSSSLSRGMKIETGVIDSGYTGTIKVSMTANEPSLYIVKGERIAQLVIMPIANVNLIEGKVTSDGARQDGGFGSTGA